MIFLGLVMSVNNRYTKVNMTESLGSLLAGRNIDQPPEIAIIQSFIQDNFKSTPTVLLQEKQIVITVRGAALAGALRPRLPELKELCQTEKRLVIRIQ